MLWPCKCLVFAMTCTIWKWQGVNTLVSGGITFLFLKIFFLSYSVVPIIFVRSGVRVCILYVGKVRATEVPKHDITEWRGQPPC